MTQTQKNGQKPSIWAIMGPFGPILGRDFFFENRAMLLFLVYSMLSYAKNQKNLMMGSMRTGVADRWTDRRTDDGAGYIGPAERQGGSKN